MLLMSGVLGGETMSTSCEQTPNCVTTFESYSHEYEWTISNFEWHLSKPEPLQCPEVIKSPPGKLPIAEWRLEALGKGVNPLNKNANQQGKPDSRTVTLTRTNQCSAGIWARVDMTVTVQGNNVHSQNPKYVTVSVLPYCVNPNTVKILYDQCFTGYMPMSELSNYRDGNDLTIYCRIFVRELEIPVHTIAPAIADYGTQAPKFDLSKVMEGARQNGQCTDVILVTEGKEFKAHKVVLVSQSPFFTTRFEECWTEQGGNRIDMTDIPIDIMEAILSYMYTGNVTNIAQIARKLLPKAEEYQLEGLKVTCEEALSKTLTAQTVINDLLLADTHNAQKLKQSCLVFIAKNVTALKKTLSWTEERLNSGTNKNLWVEVLEFIIKSM